MPRRNDELIADNRRLIRNVNAKFNQVDTGLVRGLFFGVQSITASITVDVFKRSTGDQLLFGHPDPSKGFGNGTFGDDKQEWVKISSAEDTAVLTDEGRKAIASMITGSNVPTDTVGHGYGDSPASVTDDTLQNPSDISPLTIKELSRSVETVTYETAYVGSTKYIAGGDGEPFELSIEDGSGNALVRASVTANIDTTDEVYFVINVEIVGDGSGDAYLTTDGEESVATSWANQSNAIGLSQVTLGKESGNTLSKSSSSLNDEVYSQGLNLDLSTREVTAQSELEGSLIPDSDIPFVLGEIGFYDAEGNLVLASKTREVEIDEQIQTDIRSTFRIE